MTFLFTDIEGSTELARALGDRWPRVLEEHHELLRAVIHAAGAGYLKTDGDAFFAVLPSAVAAVTASVEAQLKLSEHSWPSDGAVRVRMGMHTGEGRLGGDDYAGLDVHRAARICSAAHGGQILLSATTAALVADALPAGVSIRDLGAHRLKDFAEPQHIYQLVIQALQSEFPPIRSLEVPTNLPLRLTSFVGRDQEVAQVIGLLDSERLVTLTGPGGTGKTRLALRAGAEVLERFPDGVFFVDLAPITDAALVPSAILTAVGPRGGAGPRSELERLQIELRDREVLLILDNFEQVIDAVAGVSAILRAAPRVRVLATSRSPLRLEAEREVPVAPLALPRRSEGMASQAALTFEAVRLFAERATTIDPSFNVNEDNARTIVEICRRLDGLPLAIELVASRLRLLSPSAILERLDRALPMLTAGPRDLPERQRTLSDTIEWSYRLLPPAAADLFQQLCVFAGGFSIEAAETVCRTGEESGAGLLEGVEALLEASLVRRAEALAVGDRFELLQTVREYGLEHLERTGKADEIRRRHAQFFMELAEALAPGFRGPELGHHMGALHVEHDNLRSALTWALGADEGDVALRICAALWRFWHLHGDLASGRRWVEQALALPSAARRSRSRAAALMAAGSLAYWQLDKAALAAWYAEALAIFVELRDESGIAQAKYNVAFGLGIRGRFEEAIELLRAAMAMLEERGDRRAVADCLFGLAVMLRLRGDLETARETGEEALAIHRELGDLFGLIGSLYVVARAAAELGDLETARALFMETLAIEEGVGERTGVGLSLDNLADLEISEGHAVRAMRLAGASEAIKEGVGGQAPPDLITLPDPRERVRPLLPTARIEAAWQEGRRMSLNEVLAYARQGTRGRSTARTRRR